jgi:hypothetical protein
MKSDIMLREDLEITRDVIDKLREVRDSLNPVKEAFAISDNLSPQELLGSANVMLGKAIDTSQLDFCKQCLQAAIDLIIRAKNDIEWTVSGLGIIGKSTQEIQLKEILRKLYKIFHNIKRL